MKSIVIILLVYLITNIGSSNSLLCYECNHKINPEPECDTIQYNSTVNLNECESLNKCLTITLFGTNETNGTDGIITMRRCADLPAISWCETLNNTTDKAVCEICDTDGCNNSTVELRP